MPTLTSLCSSCHSRPPQYKCPRCSTRTCSLACAKVHKARTLCSGVRDPGAYHSRSELNTPAAFDRDFNFISGVERGIERAARESEARGIDVDKKNASQPGNGGRGGFRGRGGRGGARGGSRGGSASGQRPSRGEVPLLKSLQRDGITVLRAPKGMSRQRENKTHWRRKGGGVSWTVEWIEIGDEGDGGAEKAKTVLKNKHTTQLHEQLMLREGFLAWRTAVARTSVSGVKRSADGAEKAQHPKMEAQAGKQENRTAQDESQPHNAEVPQETPTEAPDKDGWVLALEAVGQQPDHASKTLLPFGTGAKVKLKDVLVGRTVREFPTIYAWRRRKRTQTSDGDVATKTEDAPGPGYKMLETFIPPEPPVKETDKTGNIQGDAPKGESVEQAGDALVQEDGGATTAIDGDELGNGDGGVDEDGDDDTGANFDDGDDDVVNDQLELEQNVQVSADSNLGISGAIAAALMADMDPAGDDGGGGYGE